MLRLLLRLALILAIIGTGIELGLLGHYEDSWQWTPIAALGIGLLVALWYYWRPDRLSKRILCTTMGAFIGIGLLGIGLHLNGNVQFELEMRPSLEGIPLFWEALRGATPALSPGSMVYIGLLGMVVAMYPDPV